MVFNLNDDCLLQIFELLPLKDQIHVTEVCENFQYLIVRYIWSKKYCELHSQMQCLQSLSLRDYKTFFKANRKNIRQLKVYDPSNFAYVYNSTRLNDRPDISFYYTLKMPNINTLIYPYARVSDGDIAILKRNCPKLKKLYLGKLLIPIIHEFEETNTN